ncbi:lytic transglycosylase domain-containing protein [Agrilutibacter solisilvae]|uniref:Lytic transglycosylase domain-containing protein n=1 Tax=Agrilutibacter solisilvae TaxID=2763317 RepID=A0A974Y0H0_9GAMM|nr:lytic transglycosylase domain-containing protein [Lysobacter solisilvae]QSX78320.1 lytic transglycosylase domain-containing protein [Lysobacter solisilvae]
MKGIWGVFLVALTTLASVPAVAGTVYRCEGADGVRAYSSKRVPGAKCVVASQYKGGAQAGPVSAGPAMGSATPASEVVGSPARLTPASLSAPAAVQAAPQAPRASGSKRLVQGQVYSYIKDGVRHYSSRAPGKGVAGASTVRTIRYSFMETCFACGALPGVNFGSIRLNTEAYRSEISAAATQFGVEEAIVRAIIHAESAYNPQARSRVGAQGLMQLMPATARRFGVTNAYDPAQNIRGGVQYLGWLLKRFKGDLSLAAAGYNAGEGAVDKYKGVPPYSETQRYVQRVAVLAERYRGGGTTVASAGGTSGSR